MSQKRSAPTTAFLAAALLLALSLAFRPVSAEQECAALRSDARAYIQTAQDIHQLVLWHRQGFPQEHWQEAWAAWTRWQADPARLLVTDMDTWDQEWINRYDVTLRALEGC